MRVVRVDVGQERGHVGGDARAQVLGGQAVEVGHGLVDGLDAIAQRKLIYNLLAWLIKVDLPTLLPLGIRQTDLSTVLLAEIVEQVLVETSVLDVVGCNLAI